GPREECRLLRGSHGDLCSAVHGGRAWGFTKGATTVPLLRHEARSLLLGMPRRVTAGLADGPVAPVERVAPKRLKIVAVVGVEIDDQCAERQPPEKLPHDDPPPS